MAHTWTLAEGSETIFVQRPLHIVVSYVTSCMPCILRKRLACLVFTHSHTTHSDAMHSTNCTARYHMSSSCARITPVISQADACFAHALCDSHSGKHAHAWQ
eukprot:6200367-Pleurochrysis_carterae.AAC.1